MISKSQKGKKAYVERKVGERYPWKANGQFSRGDSCSFSRETAFGNEREAQRRKGKQSFPAPNSKAKTDGENIKATEEQTLQTKGAESRVDS